MRNVDRPLSISQQMPGDKKPGSFLNRVALFIVGTQVPQKHIWTNIILEIIRDMANDVSRYSFEGTRLLIWEEKPNVMRLGWRHILLSKELPGNMFGLPPPSLHFFFIKCASIAKVFEVFYRPGLENICSAVSHGEEEIGGHDYGKVCEAVDRVFNA